MLQPYMNNIRYLLTRPRIKKVCIGYYYSCLHFLLFGLGIFLILFNTNIWHLFILLFMMSCDAFAMVVCHDCPLTRLEEKYLGMSGKRRGNLYLKKAGIGYKCNHLYESQLELVLNMWSLIAFKLMFLLFFKTLL